MVVLDRLAERLQTEHDAAPVSRDVETIARALPMMKRYTELFSPEVVGAEQSPRRAGSRRREPLRASSTCRTCG